MPNTSLIPVELEPQAKVHAATAMSQSLSYCFERKYLADIAINKAFTLKAKNTCEGQLEPSWIKVEQVGRPLKDNGAEECFTAIQKILSSCFLPKQVSLIFLVNCEDGVSSLYLGIRPYRKNALSNDFAENLQNFISGLWAGLQCREVSAVDLKDIEKKIAGTDKNKYRSVYALTGIPSMETQYKTLYPATIDKLIAGMRNRNFTYIVFADPIEESDIDTMLYQCREYNGQAESLKSFNFSETQGQGQNVSRSHGTSVTNSTSHAVSQSNSVTKTIGGSLGIGGALASGVALAAQFFPPAAAVLGVVQGVNAVKNIFGLSGTGAGLSVNVSKANTTSHSITDTTSHSVGTTDTNSTGFSTNQSKTLSNNIVNKHIEAMADALYFHSKRFETGKSLGCWNVGVYLLGEVNDDLQSASLQLKAILSGNESVFEPIRIHDITSAVKSVQSQSLAHLEEPHLEIVVGSQTFEHPLGKYYRELTTVLTTKELSYLVNFPMNSVPGISVVDSSPEFSLNRPQNIPESDAINFGKLLYGGSETGMAYPISIRSLSRHALLSGINGSGKTNTVQAILNNLSGRIPFLVIEPAKTEYVDWAIEYNKKHPDNPINVFIPGCKSYKDKKKNETITNLKHLKLNPFELVWLQKDQTPNVLSHIDRLKSTFAAAFPMYDILPILMEDLLYTLYQNKSTDWLTTEPEYGKTMYPTLNSMSITVDKVIQNRGYEERIERNMKACFNTRIDSLKRGWKGEMLNTTHSTPWDELFEKPCVINLSYVGDDVDKGFFMSVILQFLYEYRIAQAETREVDLNDNGCRHLTIIEEAHRVMMKCEQSDMPQYKTAMMFSNMLSEIRAYGEGMLLVDQVPTRLIPDAIKNTNLKITHRLVAEDDCKAISESMGLNDEQRKVIQKLLTGQCIVSNSLSTDTYWLKANKAK